MRKITIVAEPAPVAIDLAETALLIIDIQKDFVHHGGYGEFLGNDPELLQRVIAPTRMVLDAARATGMTIIHTREGHLPDLSDCPPTKLERWAGGLRIGDVGPMGRILIRGEAGHAIVDEVAPLPGEIVIDKPGKNAFYRTGLESHLRDARIKNLLFAGVTTDVCVGSTVTAANDHGINAIVMADCVASYSLTRHTAMLDIIKAQGGIFGWVGTSKDVIAALKQ